MEELQVRDMIKVREAYLQYRSSPWFFSSPHNTQLALAGVDITVQQGTIYTLLGPSGCGKTTLLSSIIGQKCINSGKIQLGVRSLTQIGYMPQDTCLQMELSIGETIRFYGKLFNLSSEYLKTRKVEVGEFLQLPPDDRIISQLSGGEKRRVSLYIALLHNPQLLILDEPTVGLDPALAHRIWEYLVHLTQKENRTVLITTHYIEEAKKADTIGLMRNGDILLEGAPKELMDHYSVDSLDALFLKLVTDIPSSHSKNRSRNSRKVETSVKRTTSFSWSRCKAQLMNDYFWMKGNKSLIATLLLLPLVQCMIFSDAIGRHPTDLKLGVVNAEFGAGLCPTDFRFLCDPGTNASVSLSCAFIHQLKHHKITVVDYDEENEGRKGVEKNDVWGYLYFPHNYTESLLKRIESNIRITEQLIHFSQILVYMDMSNQFIGTLLQHEINEAYNEFIEKLYSHCDWPLSSARLPIKYENAVYGGENITFTDFTLPSIIEISLYFMPVIHIIGVVIEEKRNGLWPRFFISGMNLGEVMVGHVLVCLLFLVIQTLSVMVLLFGIIGNILIGSYLLYTLLAYMVGISGLAFGLFIASVCDKEFTATYVALGSFFPSIVVCGMVWPYESMHYILQKMCWYVPMTLPTEAFRSIAIRGWGLDYPHVYWGFIITIAWTFIFTALSIFVFRTKKIS